MAQYRFLTEMHVRAPILDVYELVARPDGWVTAWQDAVKVQRTAEGDPDGVGGSFDAVVRAPLGYRLSATISTVAADRPHQLRMSATGGLEGAATWNLAASDGVTTATFAFDVESNMRWLNLLTPILRPVFERSHHVVVRHAAEAAATSIDAELLSVAARAR